MSFLMDLRHGLRVLRRRPLLTLVAAASLALAIGVGTALFSVADARVLGAKSDGVVLVVRAHSTRKNLVQRAAFELQSTGSNILGTVLNGTHKSDEPYAYQSYA